MIDQNRLNAAVVEFRRYYPAAVIDREAMVALIGAWEKTRKDNV